MRKRKENSGFTLVEVMMASLIVAGIGLLTLPFIQDGRKLLRRSQAKQVCIQAALNKIKAYRAAKLSAITFDPVGGACSPGVLANDTCISTAVYSANTTFNWLKMRYNAVKDIEGGCVDLTSPPASGNIYGLRENIDNHGGPGVGLATIPNTACFEEDPITGACPGPGIRDQLLRDELGGNELALYVNLQVVSRAPRPNPHSQFLQATDTVGSAVPLADLYHQCAVSPAAGICSSIPNVTPMNDPNFQGLARCNQAIVNSAGGTYPSYVTDAAQANAVYRNDPNTDPLGPTSLTPSPYIVAQPACPFAGIPGSSFDFLGSDSAVRVIVTGAVLIPGSVSELWGYPKDLDLNLPDDARSNRALMCQVEEVIAPEEPQIRYYLIKNDGFYDNRGNKVLQTVYSADAGGTPVGIAVSPDNSLVYVAYSSHVMQYNNCSVRFNAGTNSFGLDCDIINPTDVRSYSLPGTTNIIGFAIDFINFPDVMIAASSKGGGQFSEYRFDPFVADNICAVFNGSPRLASKGIIYPPGVEVGGMIISSLNNILLYDASRRGTFFPTTPNNSMYFFQFNQSGPAISAISQ